MQPVARSQRNALIWEAGAAVIVSSSGMLAGGPSVAYARALAGRAENAILLTGYQDEESPGRLQEMAQRGAGTLRLGKDKVDVQCKLATYSLSAHADTGQLVSFVETLDPTQVFLVHGDEAARSSLAEALRARGRRVRLPRAGQSFGFEFTPAVRPQRNEGIGGGRRPDVRRLWEALAHDGVIQTTGAIFSLETLAQTWWVYSPARRRGSTTAGAALAGMRVFCCADPAPQPIGCAPRQVELTLRRRDQLRAHGDPIGRRCWCATRKAKRWSRGGAGCGSGEGGDWGSGDWGSSDWIGRLRRQASQATLRCLRCGRRTSWRCLTMALTPQRWRNDASLRTLNAPVVMEPNQALAAANQHFRSSAAAYRLPAGHVLTLTLTFPTWRRIATPMHSRRWPLTG
jgi:hypothetical protein